MDVPVQYFQSVIAVETAVTGVLLFQIRFFEPNKDTPKELAVHPRLRGLLLIVLTATIFGSLEAIREGWGSWAGVLVTVGLAVSVLPILLRAATAAARCANPAAPSALLDHRARPCAVRGDHHGHRRTSANHRRCSGAVCDRGSSRRSTRYSRRPAPRSRNRQAGTFAAPALTDTA
jgi:hypothetical protein